METIPLISIIIILAVIIGIIVLVVSTRKSGEKRIPNYRALFIVGLTWIPIGISTENLVFSAAGVVFMIIGLANKNKWGQETKWSDLTPLEKRTKLIIVAALSLLILIAVVMFFYAR